MVKNCYIHIPFCRSKCHYCSFISYNKLGLKEKYLNALELEIKSNYKNELLDTFYFGGGTPSILSADEFFKILKNFDYKAETEITAELNPEGYYDSNCEKSNGLTKDYLKNLFDIGINRISIGAQTFNDDILKLINRRHNSSQIYMAVENAHKVGIENISLDFIYGLPSQTLEMFLQDLKTALNLGVSHISLYGLSIEKNCYFYTHKPHNIADDDVQADMFLAAVEFLTNNGYEHYEISNFSHPGFYSKHNLNYWNNNEYYGFGTAAHGYVDNIRYSNQITIEDYIKNPLSHYEQRFESEKDKLEEEIFLGFRKMEGINLELINKKFNINFENKYSKILKKYISLKLLRKTNKGYALTTNGVLLSNSILAEFLE